MWKSSFAGCPPVRCFVIRLMTPEVNQFELEETASQGVGFKRQARAGRTCMARFRRGSIDACERHRKRAARNDWAKGRRGVLGMNGASGRVDVISMRLPICVER